MQNTKNMVANNVEKTNDIDYDLYLTEQSFTLDLGLDNNNAIWTSIDKVIMESGRNINVVYKKLFEKGIISEKGWQNELLHSGAVITHTFCKDPLPGDINGSSKVYSVTLLSPTGVTYLRVFMDKFLPH